jgi:drug/metabolite transporter (DMT)-like permease
MGAGFIGAFNLMAWCAQKAGITTMALANKLSLVIPVMVAILVFGEQAGAVKVTGLVLALPAIWLINRSQSQNVGSTILWPAVLFLVSGGLDTLVNYIQSHFLAAPEDQALCTIVCFATAGTIGLVLVSVLAILGKIQLAFRNIVAGVALGVPNFFSIYFLVKALRSNLFQSSATIPLLNISILVATALVAIFVFREKAGWAKIAGLLIAVASILMIGLGDA